MKNQIDSNFAIAILALVAACVGFAFWVSSSLESLPHPSTTLTTQKTNNAVIETIADAELDTTTLFEVENWTTYTNETIGITFEYPEVLGPITNYGSQICVGGETASCPLRPALQFNGEGLFMGTMNKSGYENPPGRGGYFGDRAGEIASRSDVVNFCTESETYLFNECEVYTNQHGILIARTAGEIPFTNGDNRMLTYFVHAPNSDFYGYAFSNRDLLNTKGISVEDSEKIMNELIDSLKFIPVQAWVESSKSHVTTVHPPGWQWLDEKDGKDFGFHLFSPSEEVSLSFHGGPISQEILPEDFTEGQRERLVQQQFDWFNKKRECDRSFQRHDNFQGGEIMYCSEELGGTYFIAGREAIHTIGVSYADANEKKKFQQTVGSIMRNFSSSLGELQ